MKELQRRSAQECHPHHFQEPLPAVWFEMKKFTCVQFYVVGEGYKIFSLDAKGLIDLYTM
jgi:hypothetical protein